MRKIVIIAAAVVAISGLPAIAAEKTFDEMFPAKPSVEEWCASKTRRADDPSDHRGYNGCIDKAQIHHDYAKMIWGVLSPDRKDACVARWVNQRGARVVYEVLAQCLEGQLQAQDRETVHHFKR